DSSISSTIGTSARPTGVVPMAPKNSNPTRPRRGRRRFGKIQAPKGQTTKVRGQRDKRGGRARRGSHDERGSRSLAFSRSVLRLVLSLLPYSAPCPLSLSPSFRERPSAAEGQGDACHEVEELTEGPRVGCVDQPPRPRPEPEPRRLGRRPTEELG